MLKIKIYKIHINKLTEKNFGLIHVYFLYTVFRVTYRTLISKGYMTTKLKIAVGEGWGILSVGRVQLEFNLGRVGGKNHQCLRSTLSRWRHLATISFLLLSVVLGSAREMCVFSIRQRWQILTLLLYDGARLRMDQC